MRAPHPTCGGPSNCPQVTNDTSSPCNGMADGDMQALMMQWTQTTAGSVRQDTAYWDKIRAVRLGLLH